ncbi:MAG TPA: superoxide dismutase family protein [Chthoniobacterales bacterium]|jgi:Cu-Zn family superoxide dismutase|nr:superoxide dismutase family protein [Chthoniobacterales bacterium]
MKTMIISLGILCVLAFAAQAQDVTKATCKLESKSGSKVTGTVTFTKSGDDVQVVADIEGLTPGKHGFHIHEKGDCSAPDAASAGAHFNPAQHKHGGVTGERHDGDLGNLVADASGKAHLDWKGKMSLSGANSIIGKSVVVHEKEDDLKTDPSGNSGARLACGAIEAAK